MSRVQLILSGQARSDEEGFYSHSCTFLYKNWKKILKNIVQDKMKQNLGHVLFQSLSRRKKKQQYKKTLESLPYMVKKFSSVLQKRNSELLKLQVKSKYNKTKKSIRICKPLQDQLFLTLSPDQIEQQREMIRSRFSPTNQKNVYIYYQKSQLEDQYSQQKVNKITKKNFTPQIKERFCYRTINLLNYIKTDGEVPLIQPLKMKRKRLEPQTKVTSMQVPENELSHQEDKPEVIEIKSLTSVEDIPHPDQIGNDSEVQLFPANSQNQRSKKYFAQGHEFETMRSQYPEFNIDDSNANWRQSYDFPPIFW